MANHHEVGRSPFLLVYLLMSWMCEYIFELFSRHNNAQVFGCEKQSQTKYSNLVRDRHLLENKPEYYHQSRLSYFSDEWVKCEDEGAMAWSFHLDDLFAFVQASFKLVIVRTYSSLIYCSRRVGVSPLICSGLWPKLCCGVNNYACWPAFIS